MTSRTMRLILAVTVLALALGGVPPARAADPPAAGERLLTFHYELYGKSQDDLVREGCIRAVKSAIGRLYFTDSMLRAQTLLDPYLEQNLNRFIARRKVTTSEIRGGRRFIALDVIVNNEKIYADLNEKKFLYRPALRPLFYIFLSETYDDQPTPPVARRRLLEMIDERQYRYLWEPGSDKPGVAVSEKQEVAVAPTLAEKDVSLSPEDLQAACDVAQRSEVEVFITGTVQTKTTKSEKVYYDDYTFVETRCSLKIVRSDNGEVTASGETVSSAGHTDPAKSVAAAALGAVNEIAPGLFDSYFKQWAKMILRKADVRIMITGVDSDTLRMFRQILKGVAPGAEVYTRAAYADIAVVTVSWEGRADALVQVLRETFYPSFRIKESGPGELILEVLPTKSKT